MVQPGSLTINGSDPYFLYGKLDMYLKISGTALRMIGVTESLRIDIRELFNVLLRLNGLPDLPILTDLSSRGTERG